MLVTIFGDIHGNLVALEQLFKLERNDTDLFICHGDVVNYAPWSNECVAFLENQNDIIKLRGNHETNYLAGSYSGKNEVANAFFDFCHLRFDSNFLKHLDDYQESYDLDMVKIIHTIGGKYFYPDSDISDLKLNKTHIIGHSHHQFKLKTETFELVNTGSLGQDRTYINRACYLQLNTDTNEIELKNFVFNVDVVINEMKIRNYPKICTDYYLSKKRI